MTVRFPEFGEAGEFRVSRTMFRHAYAMLAKEENVLLPDCILDHVFVPTHDRQIVYLERLLSDSTIHAEPNSVDGELCSGHRILENHLNHWSSASGSFNISAAEGVREGSVVKTHTS